ncbi:unnamed protein product (macronuclear) [Paramecium tetraurelia]|uniref:U2A'/phosphoprotein 32 family A C-terminal domain-containing protein n=1 Tax=Paramecium tetraurelia TaxID=5888 RepID=A0BKU1_PARTE|nr:uncharacterized protein GSPATT00029789001 [Paramecium tetraurelia]CAK59158.1 unnamed protein product [Paramecium tetraurelia]|eukprot:XP_001426556.1 hypothetical protein (macronuclear) [Paramecium tetraurelia strain d4-2]
MTKPIPMALLQNKIGSQPYHEVKKLNLWGIDCEDAPSLTMFPNLQILQLSRNQIRTLKHISGLKQLKELYLEKNNIKDIKELEYLKELYNLRVLSLIENPVVKHPEYKKVALKHCLALQVLDEFKILEQDRQFLKEQELSVQDLQQNLDANSNQMDTKENQNEKQVIASKKKVKGIKKLKVEPKSSQSSNQSINGSKNRLDIHSQLIQNTNDDDKINQFNSKPSQQSRKNTQKCITKTKAKMTKKQAEPQPQYIELGSDSDCSQSNKIKTKKSTLKKLKKLSDISEQNSQLVQSNQNAEEQEKDLQESQKSIRQENSEEDEENQIDSRDEKLSQHLLSVIQNLIKFIDKTALQCLYQILCEKDK